MTTSFTAALRLGRKTKSSAARFFIALNSGVSADEIIEVFVRVTASAGLARAVEGYGVAAQIFADRA